MSKRNNACTWLCGADWDGIRPLRPFCEEVQAFLSDVSTALLRDREARHYPDVVTFAFFCRSANLEQLRAEYPESDRLGRGVTFHIAPSNVPVNFAYSLV